MPGRAASWPGAGRLGQAPAHGESPAPFPSSPAGSPARLGCRTCMSKSKRRMECVCDVGSFQC